MLESDNMHSNSVIAPDIDAKVETLVTEAGKKVSDVKGLTTEERLELDGSRKLQSWKRRIRFYVLALACVNLHERSEGTV